MCHDRKWCALLSYCFVLCIIPLVRKKDDVFVQFHARNGLALLLCETAVFFVSIVLPFLFKPALVVFGVISLGGMLAVLKGEATALPFIQSISRKIDR